MNINFFRVSTLSIGLSLLTLTAGTLPGLAESNGIDATVGESESVGTTTVVSERSSAPVVTEAALLADPAQQFVATDAASYQIAVSGLSVSPVTETVPAQSEVGVPVQQPAIVAQTIDPGRPTRSGPSYIGVGGNIGISGSSSDLSRGSFAVFSKIGLTESLSLRPAVFFDRNAAIMVPITYDFSFRDPGNLGVPVAPYLGAGVAISTISPTDVGPMVTAGIDVPVSSVLTATAAVNVGFLDTTDVGIVLGVGYTFPNF